MSYLRLDVLLVGGCRCLFFLPFSQPPLSFQPSSCPQVVTFCSNSFARSEVPSSASRDGVSSNRPPAPYCVLPAQLDFREILLWWSAAMFIFPASYDFLFRPTPLSPFQAVHIQRLQRGSTKRRSTTPAVSPSYHLRCEETYSAECTCKFANPPGLFHLSSIRFCTGSDPVGAYNPQFSRMLPSGTVTFLTPRDPYRRIPAVRVPALGRAEYVFGSVFVVDPDLLAVFLGK